MGSTLSRIIDSVEAKPTSKKEGKEDKVLYRKDIGKYFAGMVSPGKVSWVSRKESAEPVTDKQVAFLKKRFSYVEESDWEVREHTSAVKDSVEEDAEVLSALEWPADLEKVEAIAKKYYGTVSSLKDASRKEVIAFAEDQNGAPMFSFKQHAWTKIGDSKVSDDSAVNADGPFVQTMAVYEKQGKHYIRFAVTTGAVPRDSVKAPIEKHAYDSESEAKSAAKSIADYINDGFKKALGVSEKVSDSFFEKIKKGDTLRVLRGNNPGRFAEVLEVKEDGSFELRDLKTDEVFEEPKDLYAVFVEIVDSVDASSESSSLDALLNNPPKWARDKKAFEEAVKEISERDGDVDFTKLIIAYKRRGNKVADSQTTELEITDDKEYTKEQLISNPPRWVANKELWEECVDKATKGGTRSINVVVPLVIYKRMGGEKAKSKAEREAQAKVDERRMSAEASRENVEDATPSTLKEMVEAVRKAGGDVKTGIHSVISTFLNNSGAEGVTVSEDAVELKNGNSVKYDSEQILVNTGEFVEFYNVDDYEDWGKAALEAAK